MPEREPDAMDAALQRERIGMVLKTVGWVLLGMDAILVNFVWTGLRAGSKFWLIWVLVEAFLGLLLIWLGINRRAESAREVGGRRAA